MIRAGIVEARTKAAESTLARIRQDRDGSEDAVRRMLSILERDLFDPLTINSARPIDSTVGEYRSSRWRNPMLKACFKGTSRSESLGASLLLS